MSVSKSHKDTSLMIADTRHTNLRMARPKQFSDRTTLAFPPGTFTAIAAVTTATEDKSDFIRAAVELELSLRQSPGYKDLVAHLLANETVHDFCMKAILRAVAQRKAALSDDGGQKPGGAA